MINVNDNDNDNEKDEFIDNDKGDGLDRDINDGLDEDDDAEPVLINSSIPVPEHLAQHATLFEGFVAGTQFHPGIDLLHTTNAGDDITLVAEPTNQYDPHAIKVLLPSGVMLGYIPRHHTPFLHAARVNGRSLIAWIQSIQHDQPTHRRVTIHVKEGAAHMTSDVSEFVMISAKPSP